MSHFFTPFPMINYDVTGSGTTQKATNLMLRFKFRDVILKYTEIMFEYVVKDGEKPFIVADKYYGRADLSELVLLTNNVIDPYYQWPMSNGEFNNFIIKKYGSLEYATHNVHSYWKIVQPETMRTDGTIIKERLLRIDRTTYLTLPDEERKSIYYFDYENDLNESRRRISLIEKHWIPQIEDELKNILK